MIVLEDFGGGNLHFRYRCNCGCAPGACTCQCGLPGSSSFQVASFNNMEGQANELSQMQNPYQE